MFLKLLHFEGFLLFWELKFCVGLKEKKLNFENHKQTKPFLLHIFSKFLQLDAI